MHDDNFSLDSVEKDRLDSGLGKSSSDSKKDSDSIMYFLGKIRDLL